MSKVYDCGRLFWMPSRQQNGTVGLGLSSGLRNQTATATATEDLRVLGATTDLASSLATLRDGSENLIFSNADALLTQIAGKRTLPENYRWFDPPFLLRENNEIIVDALSAGAETNGNLIFLAEPADDAYRRRVEVPDECVPFKLVLSAGLAGNANERKTATTDKSKHHTIIKGAGSDLSAVSIRIDDPQGRGWMSDDTPIWAVCGYTSGDTTLQHWPRYYYLPPGARLRVEFINPASGPESNGKIYFDCVRW